MAFGVMACNAISTKIARRVGSAMAWKTSRLIYLVLVMQLIGCKYMCSQSTAQIYFHFLDSIIGRRGIKKPDILIPGYM
jgi:hypothetical protein